MREETSEIKNEIVLFSHNAFGNTVYRIMDILFKPFSTDNSRKHIDMLNVVDVSDDGLDVSICNAWWILQKELTPIQLLYTLNLW